jgi:hypothetical protein
LFELFNQMQILYGARGIYADVTNKFDSIRCFVIPHGDVERGKLLEMDPVPWVVKHIILIPTLGATPIIIPATDCVSVIPSHDGLLSIFNFKTRPGKSLIDIYLDLTYPETAPLPVYSCIHEILTLMIEPDDKVLNLGAWTGTTACIISKLLTNSDNLVCLESNKEAVKFLAQNRDINGFDFKVIEAALSDIPLVTRKQSEYSSSLVKYPAKPGLNLTDQWVSIPTISWKELNLNRRYTLVADCDEGLYYICKSYPDFFTHFDKVIVENDYHTIEKKQFVESELKRNGFILIWRSTGDWGPCKEEFYEAWKRHEGTKA